MTPHLIGLSGYAQTGKDTVGQLLVQEWDYQRVAFADSLREMLYALNPMVDAVIDTSLIDVPEWGLTTFAVQALVDEVGWERAKAAPASEGSEQWSVRAYLQRLGTEAGRDILGDDIWVKTAHRKVQAAQFKGYDVVITDVRFPNEYAAVLKGGGQVWRITRPGITPATAHVSETALDDFHFDVTIDNSGSYDDLARKVAGILEGT